MRLGIATKGQDFTDLSWMELRIRGALHRGQKRRNAKQHRAAKTKAGRCINEHSKPHALPQRNLRTGKRYTKCDDCREIHKKGSPTK